MTTTIPNKIILLGILFGIPQAPGKTEWAGIHTLKAGRFQIGFASSESSQAIPLSADLGHNVR